MNKLFLVLALLFALSACSVGKKCTYTQDGTKISSWVWFYGDKPIDLDKNNCSCDCHCSLQEHSDMYGVCSCSACSCDKGLVLDDTKECETCQ